MNVVTIYLIVFTGLTGAIDVVFAMDGSRAVDSETFDRMRKFIQGSLKAYNISNAETRIGLMVYGGETKKVLSLTNGNSQVLVDQTLDRVKRIGGERQMTDALNFGLREFFKVANRPEAARLLVLMTTGKNDQVNNADTQRSVDALKREKINLLVIGVGRDVDDSELKKIVDSTNKAVTVDNADKLREVLTDVIDASGKAVGMCTVLSIVVD